jgi:putative N-acetylmannosamine-6-phosphate epimerase
MKSSVTEKIRNKFALMVSIPQNHPDMAAAAEEAGADAIKTHLNVHHYASGTYFGSWSEEKENIKAILRNAKIPVGLLPGADSFASRDEILEAREMGIDFLDSFVHHMPVYLWEIENLGMMLAVNQSYTPSQIASLEEVGVDIFEATLLTHEEYGTPLNMRDITLYHNLAHSTKKPVIVPTQKKIHPEEVKILKQVGISGIVIGAVVTDKTPEGVYNVTESFRRAIDRIG